MDAQQDTLNTFHNKSESTCILSLSSDPRARPIQPKDHKDKLEHPNVHPHGSMLHDEMFPGSTWIKYDETQTDPGFFCFSRVQKPFKRRLSLEETRAKRPPACVLRPGDLSPGHRVQQRSWARDEVRVVSPDETRSQPRGWRVAFLFSKKGSV